MKTSFILLSISILILIGILSITKQKSYILPKVVWTHWDKDSPPEVIQKNIQHTQRRLKDWEIKFITTDIYLKTLSNKTPPKGFEDLGVEHQADWIRLHLLYRYGGCWMDAGIIVNESINPLYRECVSNQADLLVFKNKQYQTNIQYPVAENWFILAPAGSEVVRLWLEEYTNAIEMGFHAYKKELKKSGVDLQELMKIKEDVYLTQHGCFQKVIQQRIPNTKILYHNAEDTMFRIQAKECKWDKDCIKKKLEDVEYCKKIPYIKLRGTDRKDANVLPLLV